MGTAVVFVERGAVVYKGSVASWWSGLSRTCPFHLIDPNEFRAPTAII